MFYSVLDFWWRIGVGAAIIVFVVNLEIQKLKERIENLEIRLRFPPTD